MKKLLSIAALSMLSLSSLLTAPAQAAGTATGSFNVAVTLNSKCELTTAPTALSFTYTSFQIADVTNNTSIALRCTNSLPYTLALSGTDLVSATGVTANTATGLNYTLALSATANDIATVGTVSSTGTGSTQNFFVNGSMAFGQAGTCATGSCNSTQARTLTVAY